MSRPSLARGGGRALRAGSAAAWLLQALLALVLALLLVGLVAAGSGRLKHLARVADDQVGVLVDFRSGRVRAIDRSGYQLVLPGLQAVHTLTRSPLEYVMRGGERDGTNQVPWLVVRARDGSRYGFDRVSIQYAVDATRPESALLDSGPDDGFSVGLVDAFARSVLQEEFGRYDAGEIVLPESRRSATERAHLRLEGLLARHGIVVLEVSLSKPRFDERYEQTIERRKVAEREIERLQDEATRMQAAQAQEERQLDRKLELQLAKDSDTWQRELDQTRHAAALLEAGWPEELARLERERELALEEARAEWSRAIAQAQARIAGLEGTREARLAAVRDAQERERSSASRERAQRRRALEHALATLEAGRAERLGRVRGEGELARAQAEAKSAAELAAAHQTALRATAEAEAQAAEREQQGQLEGRVRLARAAEQIQRHAREAETFRTLAQALEGMGEAGVRAALVQVLSGVQFELAAPGSEEDRPTAARAALRR